MLAAPTRQMCKVTTEGEVPGKVANRYRRAVSQPWRLWKFIGHAETQGLGYQIPVTRVMKVLQTFDASMLASYAPTSNTQAAATVRSTLMVTALSYAFSEDLRSEFESPRTPFLANFRVADKPSRNHELPTRIASSYGWPWSIDTALVNITSYHVSAIVDPKYRGLHSTRYDQLSCRRVLINAVHMGGRFRPGQKRLPQDLGYCPIN